VATMYEYASRPSLSSSHLILDVPMRVSAV
jgi:hypothetical protein